MITSTFLKGIYTEARPIIERHLDDSELLAGMREVVAAQGGDWSSLKALITADVKDGRDDAGDGKRVKKILDKADYSAAYADMLGLAKMNDGNNSAETSHDPETGEIFESEPDAHHDGGLKTESAVAMAENAGASSKASCSHDAGEVHGRTSEPTSPPISAAAPPSLDDLEIPAFLRRPKPPPRQPSA